VKEEYPSMDTEPTHRPVARPVQHRDYFFDDAPASRVPVRSRSRGRASGELIRALIDRRAARDVVPLFVWMLAIAGLALSGVTTVMSVQWCEIQLTGTSTWVSLVIGIGVALTLFIGQLTWSGIHLPVYAIFLLPDLAMTVWQLYPAVRTLTRALAFGIVSTLQLEVALEQAIQAADICAAVLLLVVGTVSAWLPERVIMGKR
jgi:hypothetical protein